MLQASYIGNQMLNGKEMNEQSLLLCVSGIFVSIYLLFYMARYHRA